MKTDKINLLKDLYANRVNVLNDIIAIDKNENHKMKKRMEDLFFEFNNKNKRNKAPVEQLAMWILKISKIFGACLNLRRSLREQKKEILHH